MQIEKILAAIEQYGDYLMTAQESAPEVLIEDVLIELNKIYDMFDGEENGIVTHSIHYG